MIAQELSYYPASYDDEQQHLAELQHRTNEQIPRYMGALILDDMTTLIVGGVISVGTLETSPANTSRHEQATNDSPEAAQRMLASTALRSAMNINSAPVNQALAEQDRRQTAYELAA